MGRNKRYDLETIQKMIDEGLNWEEIGTRLKTTAAAVRRAYYRYLEQDKTKEKGKIRARELFKNASLMTSDINDSNIVTSDTNRRFTETFKERMENGDRSQKPNGKYQKVIEEYDLKNPISHSIRYQNGEQTDLFPLPKDPRESSEFLRFFYYCLTGKVHRGKIKALKRQIVTELSETKLKG